MMKRFQSCIFIAATLLAGTACAANPITSHTGLTLEKINYNDLPGWRDDEHGEALAAFQLSCTKLQRLDADFQYGKAMLKAPASEWQRICAEAATIPTTDHIGARSFFERQFTAFKAGYQGNFKGLFTGYYEPLMRGSRTRSEEYNVPVLAPPADLVSGQTYPLTRTDIESGALKDQGLEVLWLSSPVDKFFTQVQGSGRVLLDTGETVALRYAGKNNQPYTAIGKVLVERGALNAGEVTAPAIREWLLTHPSEAGEVMRQNASYVFFSVQPDVGSGPVGAQNVPLTPQRSLAVDASYFPLGIPLFLSTTLPDTPMSDPQPYQRLMIAQDKGSAIEGAVRGDIFFGFGELAEALAGHMQSEGEFVVLVPDDTALRIQGKGW